MNRREFVAALESYFEKNFNDERLRVLATFTEREGIPERKYEELYYQILSIQKSTSLPAMPVIIEAWQRVKSSSSTKEEENMILQNNATIEKWWGFPVWRIVEICKKVSAKTIDEWSYTDKEWINQFDFVMNELSYMKGRDAEFVHDRIEYIIKCKQDGENYLPLETKATRHLSEEELKKVYR